MPIRAGRLLGAVAAVLVLSTSALRAHDTWLLPAEFTVPAGATVRLDLTSAMRFPEPETPLAADRLAVTGARIGGRTLELQPVKPTAAVLPLSVALPADGIAALWVESRPRTLSLKPAEVEEYLHEIGAPERVRSIWKKTGRWRESYRKIAKTFVRVGSGAGDTSWRDPVGAALEIVPEQDPTGLRAGDVFRVRVLHDGRGLAGFSVGAATSGMSEATLRTTDGDGRVAFTLDRPGPWLLKGTRIVESTAADRDWDSVFTTLTVSVLPAR